MQTELPSSLFPGLMLTVGDDNYFESLTPIGYKEPVSLYLSEETASDRRSLKRAGAFIDRLAHWDSYCRARLSEGAPAVLDFFSFYAEEYPGYFAADDIERLSLAEKVGLLRLQTIAVHDSGDAQTFAIDFTFDGEEVLCVLFDADFAFDRIVWES